MRIITISISTFSLAGAKFPYQRLCYALCYDWGAARVLYLRWGELHIGAYFGVLMT